MHLHNPRVKTAELCRKILGTFYANTIDSKMFFFPVTKLTLIFTRMSTNKQRTRESSMQHFCIPLMSLDAVWAQVIISLFFEEEGFQRHHQG